MGISPALEEISFWFLDTFLRCFFTSSKCLQISCMSVILLVGLLTYWNQAWIRYFSENFWNHSWEVFTPFPNNQNFFVCQSVSWLTSLLKLDKYRDIFCPGWDIFLNFFGDIPEMFLHFYQMLTNFLYVCQLVSWLTCLLKLFHYRDISCPRWDIFLNFFGDIPEMSLHFSK